MTNPRTVLIGLDGATFSILDAMMRDGEMPFLREFCESGVRSALRTVIPAPIVRLPPLVGRTCTSFSWGFCVVALNSSTWPVPRSV